MRLIVFQAFCKNHNSWETYSLGDLVAGESVGMQHEFAGDSWRQYTGHKLHGVDVFENDIIRYIPPSGQTKKAKLPYIDMAVVWDDKRSRFILIWKSGGEIHSQRLHNVVDDPHHQVIGNVFDLKKGGDKS